VTHNVTAPANPAPRHVRWLNATVLGIGLASLLSDMGHEMATAVMPAFVASIGGGVATLGLIEGLADGVASFTKLASGVLSDRVSSRKPIALVGYALTSVGVGSFAIATNAWQVLAGRVIAWFGRGLRSPVRKVLLAEATTAETYGRAFGLERAMDSAGAVAGPAIAVALLVPLGPRGLFALTVVPGVLAAAAIGMLVREPPPPAIPMPRPHASVLRGFADLPRPFRRFVLGAGIAGLGDFSKTLLILFATRAWVSRYGTVAAVSMAMGLYVAYNVVYTASAYASGWLADRMSKPRMLAFGYALAAVPALALLVPGASMAKFAVVFGISGVYMGIWETVQSSTAAAYLPRELRGTGFGLLDAVNGVGDVVSSVVVGALWVASPALAMAYVVAMSLTGSLIVAVGPQTNAA